MKITTCTQNGMIHMFKCVQRYLTIKRKRTCNRIAFSFFFFFFLIANRQRFFLIRSSRTFRAGLAALHLFWHRASSCRSCMSSRQPICKRTICKARATVPHPLGLASSLWLSKYYRALWAWEETGDAELGCRAGGWNVLSQTELGSCLLIEAAPC